MSQIKVEEIFIRIILGILSSSIKAYCVLADNVYINNGFKGMKCMLKKEFEYFLEHREEFAKKYNGRFIVIKNREVIGDYKTEIEAVEETSKKEEIGTFLVQKCEPGDQSFTQTFHSRVSFI